MMPQSSNTIKRRRRENKSRTQRMAVAGNEGVGEPRSENPWNQGGQNF